MLQWWKCKISSALDVWFFCLTKDVVAVHICRSCLVRHHSGHTNSRALGLSGSNVSVQVAPDEIPSVPGYARGMANNSDTSTERKPGAGIEARQLLIWRYMSKVLDLVNCWMIYCLTFLSFTILPSISHSRVFPLSLRIWKINASPSLILHDSLYETWSFR